MALNNMHPCHSSLKLFVVTYTFYTLHFLSAQVPSQGYLFALMDQGSRIVGRDNTKQTRVIKGSFICNIGNYLIMHRWWELGHSREPIFLTHRYMIEGVTNVPYLYTLVTLLTACTARFA